MEREQYNELVYGLKIVLIKLLIVFVYGPYHFFKVLLKEQNKPRRY